MFSVMAFMFLAFFGIVLVLFYMMRVAGQRHGILREELLKTQNILRALEARLSAPDKADLNATAPVAAKRDDALASSEYAVESLLAMRETGAPRKTEVFDPALDLHFDSTADKR
ncbi:MAG: hypothetical protein LBR94_09910 [Desulfovibrio sp.]|jgi:hypothetical protein|nr:hypothetical protein [Desulfovibrio sp.]